MNRSPTVAMTSGNARATSSPVRTTVGDWRLVRPLSVSPRAKVFEACPASQDHDAPGEYIAKILSADLTGDARAVAMFRREVCVGGKVCHRHLVPVVDAGTTPDAMYLVMPRVDGTTLEERLSAIGRFEWDQACWIVRQAAQALAYLHSEGWLHGDIKPSNLLVADDGHVTLLDLGFVQPLARAEASSAATSVAQIRHADSSQISPCLIGTLKYLAPERLSCGGPITTASDVYSLGLMMHEMLAGVHPYASTDDAQLARMHRETLPGDLRDIDPTIPESLANLLPEMLAKDPLRRLASCDPVIRCLVSLEIAALSQARVSA